MIKKIKMTHIGIAIIVLCIISILTNYFLHTKYGSAFEKEEICIEDGKSNRIVSKNGIYNYRIDEESGAAEIIAYNVEDEKVLIIPKKIDGYIVTSIGETAFAYHVELEKIYVPDTVTRLKLAFVAGCKRLKEIVFQADVSEIEKYAFTDFTGTVVVPKNSYIYSFAKDNDVKVQSSDK